MAEIEVYDKGSTSFSVKLTGLQTKDITYTRKCAWTVYEVSSYNSVASSITYIQPGYSEGGDCDFKGLSPNTRYEVNCYITRTDTGAYLTSLSSDPFYTESDDSGGDEQTWSLGFGNTLHVYTDTDSTTVELQDNTLFKIDVYFEYSGTAHFRAYSDTDINGYITYDTSWTSEHGTPTNIEMFSGNGASGWLDIPFTVTAGEYYSFWVRGMNGTESGEVIVEATEPWNVNGSSYGTLSGAKSETISLNTQTLYWRKVVFSKSGTVTFSTTGSVDTRGWLSTSNKWEYGYPNTDYVLADNDDYNDVNFSITYDVVAGQTYYIFFRAYSGSDSGITVLNISDVTEKISIDKWSWSASNGSAAADETYQAYSAVLNGRATTDFSHLVWNDLVDKVYELVVATTNWWDSGYASYYDTKMHSEPYELTAVMFNSLRNNIELVGLSSHVNLGYKTGIGKVESENTNYPVNGEYFTTIASYINSCIDNL